MHHVRSLVPSHANNSGSCSKKEQDQKGRQTERQHEICITKRERANCFSRRSRRSVKTREQSEWRVDVADGTPCERHAPPAIVLSNRSAAPPIPALAPGRIGARPERLSTSFA